MCWSWGYSFGAPGWDARLCPIAVNPPASLLGDRCLQLKAINEERAAQPCFAEDLMSHPKGFISFYFIRGARAGGNEGWGHAELGEATARVTRGWVLLEGCSSSIGSRISPVRLCWLLQLSPSFIHLFLLPKSPLPSPDACTSPFCPARIPFPSTVGKGNKGWQRS